MARFAAVLLTFAMCFVVPSAEAKVLLKLPPKHLTTSGCIGLEARYQASTGGSNVVSATLRHKGRVYKRKKVRATDEWTLHILRCGGYPKPGLWKLKLKGGGWNKVYRIRVTLADH